MYTYNPCRNLNFFLKTFSFQKYNLRFPQSGKSEYGFFAAQNEIDFKCKHINSIVIN